MKLKNYLVYINHFIYYFNFIMSYALEILNLNF